MDVLPKRDARVPGYSLQVRAPHIPTLSGLSVSIPGRAFGDFPFWELLVSLGKIEVLRVIEKKILREFWTKHADCEQQLKAWYREAEKGEWRNSRNIFFSINRKTSIFPQ